MVLRIAANYCFHGSNLLTADTETELSKGVFYWGDHSKVTSLPEFRLSMLLSRFSLFLAVTFLIRSSAAAFFFGALYRALILQSKPNWNSNNQQCWKKLSSIMDNKLESMNRQLEESSITQMSELKKIRLTEPHIFKKNGQE